VSPHFSMVDTPPLFGNQGLGGKSGYRTGDTTGYVIHAITINSWGYRLHERRGHNSIAILKDIHGVLSPVVSPVVSPLKFGRPVPPKNDR